MLFQTTDFNCCGDEILSQHFNTIFTPQRPQSQCTNARCPTSAGRRRQSDVSPAGTAAFRRHSRCRWATPDSRRAPAPQTAPARPARECWQTRLVHQKRSLQCQGLSQARSTCSPSSPSTAEDTALLFLCPSRQWMTPPWSTPALVSASGTPQLCHR